MSELKIPDFVDSLRKLLSDNYNRSELKRAKNLFVLKIRSADRLLRVYKQEGNQEKREMLDTLIVEVVASENSDDIRTLTKKFCNIMELDYPE